MQSPLATNKNEADYYSLLNVPPSATSDQIQQAYKSLSRTFHPDRLRARNAADAELAQETFVKIKAAHDILCDPVYRFAYDQYGHEGVAFLRQCQTLHEGRQANAAMAQQSALPLDSHLYSKLQKILQQQQSSETSIMTGEEDMHIRLAIQIFKVALERYKQQLQVLRQRVQDSTITFEATIELPCAHHPQGAAAFHAMEATRRIPYLELEQAELDFSIRTTNRRQNNVTADDDDADANDQPQPTPQQPQRHIYTTTFGASTQWDGTAKSGAEVTLGADYQLSPTSKTTWTTEMTTPVTRVSDDRRPIKVQFSSTHEFVSGTVMNAGIRGSNISLNNWEYFLTSFRKLHVPWLEEDNINNADKKNTITTNLRGTMAMGMKMFTAQPLFGFVTLTTIPPPKQDHHHDSYYEEPEQDEPHSSSKTDSPSFYSSLKYFTNRIVFTAKSIWWTMAKTPWSLSIPELSLRAGYHPNPILASIKYGEFGKPWASFFASWAWSLSQDCSKIKVLLSTDMWGLFRDNDTTTLRTGLKHDMHSGWIWLWEWEELDWTLKVPISLSMTKNNQWMAAAAMGTTQAAAIMGETNNDDVWHNSLGALLASCIVLKVARSMVSDWTTTGTHDGNRQRQSKRQKRNSDPMMSQENQDSSFRLDGDEGDDDDDVMEGSPGNRASLRKQMAEFKTIMTNIAAKKRAAELHKNGLVIRFAKLNEPSSKTHALVEGAMLSNTVRVRDLTDTLQFWTTHQSKVDLPPLSSQSAPYYYMMGGATATEDASSSRSTKSWSSVVSSVVFPLSLISNLNGFDKLWKPQQLQPVMDMLLPQVDSTSSSSSSDSKRRRTTKQPQNSSSFLVIRYQFKSNVYELTVYENDPIILPSSDALLLGSADSIQ